jgi:hypothetical protein
MAFLTCTTVLVHHVYNPLVLTCINNKKSHTAAAENTMHSNLRLVILSLFLEVASLQKRNYLPAKSLSPRKRKIESRNDA